MTKIETEKMKYIRELAGGNMSAVKILKEVKATFGSAIRKQDFLAIRREVKKDSLIKLIDSQTRAKGKQLKMRPETREALKAKITRYYKAGKHKSIEIIRDKLFSRNNKPIYSNS